MDDLAQMFQDRLREVGGLGDVSIDSRIFGGDAATLANDESICRDELAVGRRSRKIAVAGGGAPRSKCSRAIEG